MEQLINQVFEDVNEKMSGTLDDKLRECCKVWGVDVNNPQEIFGRCIITRRDWSELKEFRIDGRVVLYFSDWKIDAQDINQPFNVSASMKISKIITPSDYGIK